MKKICILTTIGFLISHQLLAISYQPPEDTLKKNGMKSVKDSAKDDSANVRSYTIGLSYGSDQSFHGLHSNIKLPYLEPSFTYSAPKGFYVGASGQYVFIPANKGGGFDALDLNPGWNIDLPFAPIMGDGGTTLNFNLSHYFFKPSTPLTIRSDLSNAFETYIEQWVGNTKGKFSIDYDYYKKTSKVKTPNDWVFTPDLEHIFKITFTKKTSLSLIPEGSADFGTRNAYTHFAVNAGDTTFVTTRNGKEVQESEIPTNSGFGTLDYTLIFTADLTIGNFDFEPAFNFVSPLYKPEGQPNTSLGYITILLTYTIE